MTKKRFSGAEIASCLERSIVENAMIPGVRLPSARQLAVRYSVAPKTADRALDQLVRKGLILRQRGRGNFVRDNRDPAKRLRVGFLWWSLNEEIGEFRFNPADIFFRTLCSLLERHRIHYDVYRENCRHLEQPANREKKYDIFLVPAGVILNNERVFRSGRTPIVIYGDHKFNPGSWHQVIYDYRPGFMAMLQYCREKNWHRFFLPGRDLPHLNDRYEMLLDCAKALGFPHRDFCRYNASGDHVSTVEAGERCAEYFLKNRLQDHVILCGSDFLTFGMQNIFNRAKLKPRQDYMLMSYDNFGKYVNCGDDYFQLPSITHPQEQHAAAVVDMIEELTRRPEAGYYRAYVTPANEFVLRRPTDNLPQGNEKLQRDRSLWN